MKRLQIVEQSMKQQRDWQTRTGSTIKAYDAFNADIASLVSFAESVPQQAIECEYLWRLSCRLEVCHAPLIILMLGVSV